MRKIIYNKPNLAIYFDEKKNLIYTDWKGIQTPQSISTGGIAMMRYLEICKKDWGCCKILNDNRNVVGSWIVGDDFSEKEWFDQMFEAGLKYFAWILSPNTLSNISIQRMLSHGGRTGVDSIKVFYNIEDASAWLDGK